MKDVEFVIAWTTLPTEADVATLSRTLVDERLAACVTFYSPVQSVYRWRDRVVQESEQIVLIKTTARRVEALWARLSQLHPYEVPEFIVAQVIDGNAAYLNWIKESTG